MSDASAQPLCPPAAYQKKIQARRAAKATPLEQWQDDTGMEDVASSGTKSPAAQEVDKLFDSISIREIFDQIVHGRYKAGQASKTTGEVYVHCFLPGHKDEKASASINLEKGKFMCYPCQPRGFDKAGVAAHGLGYAVPVRENFFKVKKETVRLLRGYDYDDATTVIEIIKPELIQEPEPEEIEEDIPQEDYPTYNLKDILPDKNTFLDAFCAEGLKIALPVEFHLFVGLTALSVAVGRRAAIKRIEVPTYCNLIVCLVGNSASGKGRSMGLGASVVQAALPLDETPLEVMTDPTGVLVTHLPGSGEQLVKNLDVSRLDSDGRVISKNTYTALVQFDEMSRLVTKAGGKSEDNSFKSYIIEFADSRDEITTNAGGKRSTVYEGFASFITSTQPGHLRSQFAQRDKAGGFLNRIIPVFGRALKQDAFGTSKIDRTLPTMLLRDTHNWVNNLSITSDTDFTSAHWYRDEDWAPAARTAYQDFIDNIIDPECERNLANSDILGRMRINILRLILLFAVNLHSETIEAEHVESATRLYPYMKACALALTSQIKKTENSENMELILSAVKKIESGKQPRPPTKLMMIRADAKVGHMNEEEFTQLISKLVQSGQLHRVTTGRDDGKGRAGNCWSTMPWSHWKKLGQQVRESDKSDNRNKA